MSQTTRPSLVKPGSKSRIDITNTRRERATTTGAAPDMTTSSTITAWGFTPSETEHAHGHRRHVPGRALAAQEPREGQGRAAVAPARGRDGRLDRDRGRVCGA